MAPKKQQKKGHAEAPVETIFQLLVSLGEPPDRVWRRVLVSSRTRFSELHTLLQLVMGWGDEHEHQFLVHEKHYGPDEQDAEPRIYDERKPSLASRLEVGDEFHYLYDFGDSWEHRITVTRVRQGDPDIAYPRYLGGCGAGPPEDCGGVPGFYDLLGARADPDHPEHAQAVEWLDDYDPDEVEVLPIKYALDRIAARRNAAKTRLGKKT